MTKVASQVSSCSSAQTSSNATSHPTSSSSSSSSAVAAGSSSSTTTASCLPAAVAHGSLVANSSSNSHIQQQLRHPVATAATAAAAVAAVAAHDKVDASNFELLKVLGTGGIGSQREISSLRLWQIALIFVVVLLFPHKKSVRQGVSGAQEGRQRPWQVVRDEGAQEGLHSAQGQDHRAHTHRAASVGVGAPGALSGHAVLRLSDRGQASPHTRVCARRRALHTSVQARALHRARVSLLHWRDHARSRASPQARHHLSRHQAREHPAGRRRTRVPMRLRPQQRVRHGQGQGHHHHL